MSVLQKVRVISDERLDLPDFLNLDNFSCADWDEFFSSFMADTSFVVKGFDITNPAALINTPNTEVTINIANSVMFHPTSSNVPGGFYVAPASEPAQTVALTPNATNYIELDSITTTGAPDTRSFWDQAANGGQGAEFTQIIDTVTFLKTTVSVNTIGFTQGKIPIAKVAVNNAGPPVITAITDSRPMFYRLGTGGNAPNALFNFDWPNSPAGYSRTDTPTTITSSSDPNPFAGSDKNIRHFKDWMNAVMSRIKELSGSAYWFTNGGLITGASLSNLWWDSVGSRLTGTGSFVHSGGASSGFLDFGNINILDGETFTLNDGQNSAKIFEFDNNGSVIGGHIAVTIGSGAVTVLNTIQEFRDATIAAINGVGASLLITAEIGGNGRVSLSNDEPGPQGNIAITETVADAGFTVSGMASGANVGTLSWTSDFFVRSIIGNYYFKVAASSVTLADDEVAYIQGVDANGATQKHQIRNQPLPSSASLDFVGADPFPPYNNSATYINGSAGAFTGLVIGDFIKKDSDGYERYVRIKNFRSGLNGSGGTTTATLALSVELEVQMVVSGATGLWNVGNTITGPTGTAVIDSILKNRTLDSNDVRVIVTNITGTFNPSDALTTTSGGAGAFVQLIGRYEGSTASETAQYAKSLYTIIVSKRDDVPNSADVWWLAYRDDNASTTARIFLLRSGAELAEGESIGISSQVPAGLLTYVGTPSETDSTPDYATDATDAIAGSSNYNTANGESLTSRVSKLTSMMADKAQDKNIEMLVDGVIWTWNLATQTLSWNATVTFQIPSSSNNNTLASGSVVLQANKVAYVTLNRNSASALTASTILFDGVPQGENVFVFARRDGNSVLIGSSFRLEPTDAATGEYTDNLRNDKLCKPIINQSAANNTFSIYPSQRLSGGKRRYTYINPNKGSKFPRNGSGLYDGGVNNDQLTVITFDASSTPGTILVKSTFPSIAIATVSSVPTPPIGQFVAALIQIQTDDSLSVVFGSNQTSLANAILDDNLPAPGNSVFPVAIAILEVTGATTLAAIDESHLIDSRPSVIGTPPQDLGADFDKHQDTLSENNFDEIFIDIFTDSNNINLSNTTLTFNGALRRLTSNADAALLDYDPLVTPVTPDAASPAWTTNGDASMDSIVSNKLRVNDANAAASLFYSRTEAVAVANAHMEISSSFQIISTTPGPFNYTGVFWEMNDDTKRIALGVFNAAGVYTLALMDSSNAGPHVGTVSVSFDASVAHSVKVVKIGNHTVQLYLDGTLVANYAYSIFDAFASSKRIAFGTNSSTALVDVRFGTTSYSVYGQILETTDIIRANSVRIKGTTLPESLTPAWTKNTSGTVSSFVSGGTLHLVDSDVAGFINYSLPGATVDLAVEGRRKNFYVEAMAQVIVRTASQGALNEIGYIRVQDGSRAIIVAITHNGTTQGMALSNDLTFATAVTGATPVTGISWTDRPHGISIAKDTVTGKVTISRDRLPVWVVDWNNLPISTNSGVDFGSGFAGATGAQGEIDWRDLSLGLPNESPPVGMPVIDFLPSLTVDDPDPIIWLSSDNGFSWCQAPNGVAGGLNLDGGAIAAGEIIARIGLSKNGNILEDYSILYNQSKAQDLGVFKYFEYTAVGGETLINLPFSYVQGNNELEVIENGLELFVGATRDYIESSPTAITINTPADPGDLYKFRVNRQIVSDNSGTTFQGSGRREVWQITAGSNPPSSGQVSGSLGYAQALKFGPAIDEDVYFQVPIPDNCDITLPISVVLKYVMSTNEPANAVKLDLNYVVATDGDDVDPAVPDNTLSSTFTPGAGADTKKTHNTFMVSVAHVTTVNDVIIGQLRRNGTAVGDTHGGDFELLSMEIAYTPL